MDNFTVKAKNKLKSQGYKITSAREDVIDVLHESNKSISPYEIQELLSKSGSNYKVITIYRVLDLLSQLELVHRIYSINSYIKCESDHKHGHSHSHRFFVCEKCHDVQCVDLKQMQSTCIEFTPSKEINEVLGLCTGCHE